MTLMTMLPSLVDPQKLLEFLREDPALLVIDLCDDESYAQGHIPGAVHVAPAQLCCGIAPAPGKLPSLPELQRLFESIGYGRDKHIVAYDDAGGSWAGRMIWTLDLIGHLQSSLLDGGIEAWRSRNYPLSREKPKPVAGKLSLTIDTTLIADKDEILQHLGDRNYAIWDARTPEEYRGQRAMAQRNGHIPGAINLEWTELADANNHGCIRPLPAIEAMLEEAGLTRDKTIVTHCQSHRRSGLTYFVAKKLLGYKNIKAYPGSWAEWGNCPDTPVER